jgi:ABC-type multidrug transport system fused ATPase/permease subunit
MAAILSARAAAARIFSVIERKPRIDATSKEGRVLQPSEVRGAITFRNVTFAYPSRPDQPVLKNFSLEIAAGESLALVGDSGSGKSTIVQLVQRLYDPQVCVSAVV